MRVLALLMAAAVVAAALARASARGSFDQGLATECAGRGSAIACYSAPGGEIAAMLGYRGHDEIIHADNLVVIDSLNKDK